eukprot:GHVH01010123.1.p1 GENE.GHVH01010123.1~~GHVH01010123.1.p1  ORF type:complete len:3163 (-),score=445.62 GHVH01010123.1:56-9544(-)
MSLNSDRTIDITINPTLESSTLLSWLNSSLLLTVVISVAKNGIIVATFILLLYETIFGNFIAWGGYEGEANDQRGLTILRKETWPLWSILVAIYSIVYLARLMRDQVFYQGLRVWVLNGLAARGDSVDEDVVKTMRSSDVTAGSIVMLRQGEYSSMDLLILVSGEEEDEVWVDDEMVSGRFTTFKKKPLFEWGQQESLNFVCGLRGFVRVVQRGARLITSSQNGFLYLNGFPRGLQFDHDNVIDQGAALTSPWMIGIVLQSMSESSHVSSVNSLRTRTFQAQSSVFMKFGLALSFGVNITSYLGWRIVAAAKRFGYLAAEKMAADVPIRGILGRFDSPVNLTRVISSILVQDAHMWTFLFFRFWRWLAVVTLYLATVVSLSLCIATVIVRFSMAKMVDKRNARFPTRKSQKVETVMPNRNLINCVDVPCEEVDEDKIDYSCLSLKDNDYTINDHLCDDFSRMNVMVVEEEALYHPSEVANLLIGNTIVGDSTIADVACKTVAAGAKPSLDIVMDQEEQYGYPPPQGEGEKKRTEKQKTMDAKIIKGIAAKGKLEAKARSLLLQKKLKVRDVERSFDSASSHSSELAVDDVDRRKNHDLDPSESSFDSRFRDSSSHGSFDSRLSSSGSPEVSGGEDMLKRARMADKIKVPGERVIATIESALDLTGSKAKLQVLISSDFDSEELSAYHIRNEGGVEDVSELGSGEVENQSASVSTDGFVSLPSDGVGGDRSLSEEFAECLRAPYPRIHSPEDGSIYCQDIDGHAALIEHQSRVLLPKEYRPFHFHLSADMLQDLTSGGADSKASTLIETFLLTLAICHNAKSIITHDEFLLSNATKAVSGTAREVESSGEGQIVVSDSFGQKYYLQWKPEYMEFIEYRSSDDFSTQMAYFASFHGYSLVSRTASEIVVQAAGKMMIFNVIASINPSADWYSFVLFGSSRSEHLSEGLSLCTAPFGDMRGYITQDAEPVADFCAESIQRDHISRVVSARYLSYDELNVLSQFANDVNRASDLSQQYSSAFNVYLHSSLTPIGAISFRGKVVDYSEQMMCHLATCDVQPWFLGTQSLETSISRTIRLGAPWFRTKGILFCPDVSIPLIEIPDPTLSSENEAGYEQRIMSERCLVDGSWAYSDKIRTCLEARGIQDEAKRTQKQNLIAPKIGTTKTMVEEAPKNTGRSSTPSAEDLDDDINNNDVEYDHHKSSIGQLIATLSDHSPNLPLYELGIAVNIDEAFRIAFDLKDKGKVVNHLTDLELENYIKYTAYAFSQLQVETSRSKKRIITCFCATSLVILLSRPCLILLLNEIIDASDVVILHQVDARILNFLMEAHKSHREEKKPRFGNLLVTGSRSGPSSSGLSFILVPPIKSLYKEMKLKGISDANIEMARRMPGRLMITDLRDVTACYLMISPMVRAFQGPFVLIMIMTIQMLVICKMNLTDFSSNSNSLSYIIAPLLLLHGIAQGGFMSLRLFCGCHLVAPPLLLTEVPDIQKCITSNITNRMRMLLFAFLTCAIQWCAYWCIFVNSTSNGYEKYGYEKYILRSQELFIVIFGLIPNLCAFSMFYYAETALAAVLIAGLHVATYFAIMSSFGYLSLSLKFLNDLIINSIFLWLALNTISPFAVYLWSDARNVKLKFWNLWLTCSVRIFAKTDEEFHSATLPWLTSGLFHPNVLARRHAKWFEDLVSNDPLKLDRLRKLMKTVAVPSSRNHDLNSRKLYSDLPSELVDSSHAVRITRSHLIRNSLNQLYGVASFFGNSIVASWLKLRFLSSIDKPEVDDFLSKVVSIDKMEDSTRNGTSVINGGLILEEKIPWSYIPESGLLVRFLKVAFGDEKKFNKDSEEEEEEEEEEIEEEGDVIKTLMQRVAWPSIRIQWPSIASNLDSKKILSIPGISHATRKLLSSKLIENADSVNDDVGKQYQLEMDHLEYRYLNLGARNFLKVKVVLLLVSLLNIAQLFWTRHSMNGQYMPSLYCNLLLRIASFFVVVYGLVQLTAVPEDIVKVASSVSSTGGSSFLQPLLDDIEEHNVFYIKLAMRSALSVWAVSDTYLTPLIILSTKLMLGIHLNFAAYFFVLHLLQFGFVLGFFFGGDLTVLMTSAVIALCCYRSLVDQRQGRIRLFLEHNRKKIERERASSILQALLPTAIVTKLLLPGKRRYGVPLSIIPRHHENTGVMFADIYLFYKLVAQMQPDKLVSTLDHTFLMFDKVIEITGITKIETVGATYLCASNLNSNSGGLTVSEHCQNLLRTAIGFLDIAVRTSIPANVDYPFPHLCFKVGMNVGGVYSGLVGSKKPQFALFGDTVNTASRMKLTSKEMRIHVSDQFIQKMMKEDETYVWEVRELKVKGKGNMLTSLLFKTMEFSQYPQNKSNSSATSMKTALREFKETFLEVSKKTHAEMTKGRGKNSSSRTDEVKVQSTAGDLIGSAEHPAGNQCRYQAGDEIRRLNASKMRESCESVLSRRGDTGPGFVLDASHAYVGPSSSVETPIAATLDIPRGRRANDNVEGLSFNRISDEQRRRLIPLIDDIQADRQLTSITKNFENRVFHGSTLNRSAKSGRGAELLEGPSSSRRISKGESSSQSGQLDREGRGAAEAAKLDPSRSSESHQICTIPSILWSSVSAGFMSNALESQFESQCIDEENTARQSVALLFLPITWLFLNLISIMANPPLPTDSRYMILYNLIIRVLQMLSFSLTCCISIMSISFVTLGYFIRKGIFLQVNSISKLILLGLLSSILVQPNQSEVLFPIPNNYNNAISDNEFVKYVDLSRVPTVAIADALLFTPVFTRMNFHLCDSPKDSYSTSLLCEGPPMSPDLPSLKIPEDSQCWSIWNPLIEHSYSRSLLSLALTLMMTLDQRLPDPLKIAAVFAIYTQSVFATSNSTPRHNFLSSTEDISCLPLFEIEWVIQQTLVLTMSLITIYIMRTDSRRLWYHIVARVESEEEAIMEKNSRLLKDMFPMDVYRDHLQGKVKLSYQHRNLGFLFTDICGFTNYSKTVDASGVLTMLQKMFSRFDTLSNKLALYKLCTIGDAYITCTEPWDADARTENDALTKQNRISARRIEMANLIYFAYCMKGIIDSISADLGVELGMRFGMHIGDCIGGIIGSKRLRYDMWGRDIEVGENMESAGVKGKVNVSETVKAFVTEHFPLDFSFAAHDQLLIQDVVYPCFIMTRLKGDS